MPNPFTMLNETPLPDLTKEMLDAWNEYRDYEVTRPRDIKERIKLFNRYAYLRDRVYDPYLKD